MLRVSSLGLKCCRQVSRRFSSPWLRNNVTHPHQVFLKTTFTQWAYVRQRRDTLGSEGGIDIVEEVAEEGHSIHSDSQQKLPSDAQTAPKMERPSIVRVLGKGVIAKLPGTVTVIPKAGKRGKRVKKEREEVVVRKDKRKDTEAVYTHFQAHLPQIPETPPKSQNHLVPFQPPVRDDIVDPPWEITEEEPPVTNDSELARSPQELLDILDTTDSISHAWDAYQHLMALPREGSRLPIPWTHLQRLTRLLVSTKPRTRTNFIRLLTVISTIHKHGGHVHLWQWNALIDLAGRGWRKTRPEDYNNAIGVFNDLLHKRDPGSTFSRSAMDDEDPTRRTEGESRNDDDDGFDNWPAPNVVTLTTLLNIAGRTLYPPTFQHASDLFRNSGMPPNRITLLARLRYFSRRGELTGVRTTISQMRDHEFDLGIEGTNACLWAYAYNGRLDIAQAIYDILKSRVWILNGDSGEDSSDKTVVELEKFLEAKEGIAVPEGIGPDLITFRALLQCFAYHGDLMQSLSIFTDMIKFMQEGHGRGGGAGNANGKGSTTGTGSDGKLDVGRKEDRDGKSRRLKRKEEMAYQTTYMLPAYRAIFLGFVRHAHSPKGLAAQKTLSYRLKHIHDGTTYRDRAAWNTSALEALFDDFLRLPSGARPSERTLYWIMVAFSRCTGDDAEKLREVYQKLEARFGGGWGGRMAWLKKMLHGGT